MHAAIIDLGTNTFHFLLFENDKVILRQTDAVRLGQDGINKKMITEEAQNRAVTALKKYREQLDAYQVSDENIYAYGTSALRSASNSAEVIDLIQSQTRIKVNIIYGFEEADLIYQGVKQAVFIKNNSLIVDIGGGSTEFVICDADIVLWKDSLEVGGERLLEEFIHHDPVLEREIQVEERHLNKVLEPVFVEVSRFKPEILIGSGGSFTTLKNMIYYQQVKKLPPEDLISYHCSIEDVKNIYDLLIQSDRAARAEIPGLPASKVDVIIPAIIMIKLLLERLELKEVFISEYSLKEGAMLKLIQNA